MSAVLVHSPSQEDGMAECDYNELGLQGFPLAV